MPFTTTSYYHWLFDNEAWPTAGLEIPMSNGMSFETASISNAIGTRPSRNEAGSGSVPGFETMGSSQPNEAPIPNRLALTEDNSYRDHQYPYGVPQSQVPKGKNVPERLSHLLNSPDIPFPSQRNPNQSDVSSFSSSATTQTSIFPYQTPTSNSTLSTSPLSPQKSNRSSISYSEPSRPSGSADKDTRSLSSKENSTILASWGLQTPITPGIGHQLPIGADPKLPLKLPIMSEKARDGVLKFITSAHPVTPNGVEISPDHPLLSLSSLQNYSDLFFTRFNTSYPLLHQATFDPDQVDTLLLISILLLGATYSNKEAHLLAVCIHDTLRPHIFASKAFTTRPSLWMLQTILLIECFGKSRAGQLQHDMSHLFHGLLIK